MTEKILESRRRVGEEKPGKAKPSSVFKRFKDRFKMLLLAGAVAAASSSCTFDIRAQMTRDASVPNDAAADVTNPGQDAKQDDARQEDAQQDATQQDASDDALQDDASVSDASEDAPKPWWDPNWQYCRKVSLFSSFPEDYSHKITLADPGFDYAHVKADLADLRFLEGTCETPDLGIGVLGSWDEAVSNPGTSLIWFKTKTPNIPSIAMYYGNPNAANIFNGNSAFIAFGKNIDFSGFTEVDPNNKLSIDSIGVNFAQYPYMKGYLYKDVGNLTGDFLIDFSVKYISSSSCNPYMMVAVTDTLVDKFIYAVNGLGYVRQSCGSTPGKAAALRVRDNSVFVDQIGSTFVPLDNQTYHVRIKRTGNSVNLALYSLKNERETGSNALCSITSNKVPSANFRYVYVPIGLDDLDGTYWTSGSINDVIVRKIVSPEPVQVMDPEQTY